MIILFLFKSFVILIKNVIMVNLEMIVLKYLKVV